MSGIDGAGGTKGTGGVGPLPGEETKVSEESTKIEGSDAKTAELGSILGAGKGKVIPVPKPLQRPSSGGGKKAETATFVRHFVTHSTREDLTISATFFENMEPAKKADAIKELNTILKSKIENAPQDKKATLEEKRTNFLQGMIRMASDEVKDALVEGFANDAKCQENTGQNLLNLASNESLVANFTDEQLHKKEKGVSQ